MSSVFYKFRNQKDSQRVTFDGTGITVFELKREIMNLSKLGDGTDFDLILKNPDTNEDYDDDTTIIPRSTTVLAWRSAPAAGKGKGGAARYVTGRAPVNAKNNYRKEQSSTPAVAARVPIQPNNRAASAMENAKTEEERIKAMFEMGGAQWEQQQQHMSAAQRVSLPGFKNKNVAVPDHPPPAGYICYRCAQKGHWIQQCPTNDNPEFENKPRIKRITGIPKSFLKAVEESSGEKEDGLTDDAREPTSVMVDADGNRVMAIPDAAAWQRYQEKAKSAAANNSTVSQGSKELQARGLECPIDKRLFVDPVKTPCCSKTYCNQCIDDALANNGLVCPNCSTEDVVIEEVIPDDEMNTKIKAYEEEKKAEKQEAQKAKSPPPAAASTIEKRSASPTSQTDSKTTSPAKRKRDSDDDGTNSHVPSGPRSPRRPSSSDSNLESPKPAEAKPQAPSSSDQDFIQQMNALAAMQGGANGANGAVNGMSMPPMMGVPNGMPMMNPMMMMGMPNGMPMMPGMNMNGMGMPMYNSGPGYGNMGGQGGNFNNGARPPTGPRQFNRHQPNQAEEPYLRKPVNPNRFQGRQRRQRQADYRELGS